MSEHLYAILEIFQAYSKNLNEFILNGVVQLFLMYEMVQYIKGIF
jgi:hypothetical protein